MYINCPQVRQYGTSTACGTIVAGTACVAARALLLLSWMAAARGGLASHLRALAPPSAPPPAALHPPAASCPAFSLALPALATCPHTSCLCRLLLQGSPYAVVSILDTMRAIKAPVSTVAFGIVGGTATAVLAAGAKGRRFSMQNTRILLQQPMGGLQGSAGAPRLRLPLPWRLLRRLHLVAAWHEARRRGSLSLVRGWLLCAWAAGHRPGCSRPLPGRRWRTGDPMPSPRTLSPPCSSPPAALPPPLLLLLASLLVSSLHLTALPAPYAPAPSSSPPSVHLTSPATPHAPPRRRVQHHRHRAQPQHAGHVPLSV